MSKYRPTDWFKVKEAIALRNEIAATPDFDPTLVWFIIDDGGSVVYELLSIEKFTLTMQAVEGPKRRLTVEPRGMSYEKLICIGSLWHSTDRCNNHILNDDLVVCMVGDELEIGRVEALFSSKSYDSMMASVHLLSRGGENDLIDLDRYYPTRDLVKLVDAEYEPDAVS